MSGSRATVVLALGLLIIGLWILRQSTDSQSDNPVSSTSNKAPRGLMGFGLWAKSLGRVVDVDPLLPLPADDELEGALLVVPPPELEIWNEKERDQVLALVVDGEVDLLVLCDEDPRRARRLKTLLEGLDVECDVSGGFSSRTARATLPNWPEEVLARGQGIVRAARAIDLLVDDKEVVAATMPHGLGRVTVLGSASVLTNDSLAQMGNAQFAARLLSRERVVFLEGHHKLRESRIVDEAFAQLGPRMSIFAFCLAALFIILGAAPRPGDPPRPSRGVPNSAAEAQARGLAALLHETRS